MEWRSHGVPVPLAGFRICSVSPHCPNQRRCRPLSISEAVRGEGAHLVDSQGRRFAFDYSAGELHLGDVVSRAIYSHLQLTTVDPLLMSG